MLKILLFIFICQGVSAKTEWVSFQKLAPTQFTIGLIQVEDKKEKMIEKFNDGDLEKYLKKKKAPAYLAKNGKYYIVDRHHTSRGLYEAFTPFDRYPIELKEDLSHLSMKNFFKHLNSKGLLYLYNKGAGPFDAETLPESITELEDDPYRSLAWMLREAGGFKKVDFPYLEFHWADFLRDKISIKTGKETELKQTLPKALVIAKSKNASHLPGYIK